MANKDVRNAKRFIEDVSVKAGDVIFGQVVVTDITKMSSEVVDSLLPGQVVLKKTSNQYHAYTVSYKEEKTRICLTYTDASVVETVSYDYTDGAWVYNSTDSTPLTE